MSDIKTTLGNFLTQPNQDFPHDCELYQGLQDNMFLVSILGNITGDKMILYGCELSGGGARREKGYVFLRTKSHPEGEVLFYEGGNISNGMYINIQTVSVSVQGNDYTQAYTIRTLAAGVGEENYSWNDFSELKTIPELEKKIEKQDNEIAKLEPQQLGFIELFAGTTIPSGYLLCDGQQYLQTQYPELYKVLGATYNTKPNYSGTTQSTTSGYFRVPDLRGRFVVGYNPNDTDYRTYGNAGGTKTVTLTASQIPSHNHSFNDYYYIESSRGGISGDTAVNKRIGNKKTDSDNIYLWYYTHNTNNTGSGGAHENRPPYYTLAYIIRAK